MVVIASTAVTGHKGPEWKNAGSDPLKGLAGGGDDDGLDGFDSMTDPLVWSEHDPTGLYYRRVTDNEVEKNGWFNSTYLVELDPGLDDILTGVSNVTFIVPLNDTHVEVFELQQVHEEQQKFLEVSTDGSTTSGNATMRTYEDYEQNQQNATDRLAHVIAEDQGGMYGLSFFNETGQNITGSIYGPEDHWTIDDILTEDGTTVDESKVVAISLDELHMPMGMVCFQFLNHLLDLTESPNCPRDEEEEQNPDPAKCDNGEDDDNDEWTDHTEDPGCDSASDDEEYDQPIERHQNIVGR